MNDGEQQMVKRLVQDLERLTAWERHFILDLKKWRMDKSITEKQHNTIAQIFQERLVKGPKQHSK